LVLASRYTARDNGIASIIVTANRSVDLFQLILGERCAGSGAGLAIPRRIVEQLESMLGYDSTFFFTLPVQQAGDHG
jgi:nitrogen-specific signal transduction histidine kinase